MIGYKGFGKDLKCRDMQYEIGKEFTADKADLCHEGLHFCEHPLDCFSYYAPADSRFCEVEAPDDDVSAEKDRDTKRVTKRLKIGAELSIKGMVDAAVKFVFDRATWTDADKATGLWGAASATGDQGAASATGDQGAASATGDQGAASATGKESIACALGYQCKAQGALGCWLVLTERNGSCEIVTVKSVKVDGVKIKPETWYTLKNKRVKQC